MALETVALMVGSDWELISAANPTAFAYKLIGNTRIMLYVGDTAPAADLQLAPAEKHGSFGPLGSARVYARGIAGAAPLECTREVSSSNPAIPILKPLALASLSVEAGSDIATTIAALQNRTAGSSIEVKLKRRRSSTGISSNPRSQSQWPPLAGTVRATFIETHPKAPNSGLETSFDFTVTPVAGGGGLGPATAAFASGTPSGTLVAAITGLAAGETIASIAPNDGRLALDTTRRNLLVGLSASAAGAIAATLTTSTGRTLAMAITVNVAATPLAIRSASQAPVAIYSLRRVVPSYTGNCLTVVDSGGTTRTLSFKADDSPDFTGWSGYGDGVTFTVTNWFDQSGGGRTVAFQGNRMKLIPPNGSEPAYIDFDTSGRSLISAAGFLDIGGTANLTALVVSKRMGYGSASAPHPRPGTQNGTYNACILGWKTAGTSGALLNGVTRTGTQQGTDLGDPLRDSLGRSMAVYGQAEAMPIEEAAPSVDAPWTNTWFNQRGAVVSAGGDDRILWQDRLHGVAAASGVQLVIGATGSGSSTFNGGIREIVLFQSATALTDAECQRLAMGQKAAWSCGNVTWLPRYMILPSGQSLIDFQWNDDGTAGAGDGTLNSNSIRRRLIPKLAEALGVPVERFLAGGGGRMSRGGSILLKRYNPGGPVNAQHWWDEDTNSGGTSAVAKNADGFYGSYPFIEGIPGIRYKRVLILHGQGETDSLDIAANSNDKAERISAHRLQTELYVDSLEARTGQPRVAKVIQPFAKVMPPSKELIKTMRRDQISYRDRPGYTLAADTGHIARSNAGDAHFSSLTNFDPTTGGAEDGFQRVAWQDALAAARALRLVYDRIDDTSIKYRGPEVVSAAKSGGSTIDLTIAYPDACGGTDFASASGTLDGFRVWNTGGDLAISSTTRVNSTTVRLTMAAALPAGAISVAYEPNFAPGLTHLRDNNPVLPMPVASSPIFSIAA